MIIMKYGVIQLEMILQTNSVMEIMTTIRKKMPTMLVYDIDNVRTIYKVGPGISFALCRMLTIVIDELRYCLIL